MSRGIPHALIIFIKMCFHPAHISFCLAASFYAIRNTTWCYSGYSSSRGCFDELPSNTGALIKLSARACIYGNNGEFCFTTGEKYIWKCLDFFRGEWAWISEKTQKELFVFRPKDILHKKGEITARTAGINQQAADILMLLGLHLKLFINVWLIIAIIVVIGIIARNR